MTYAIEMAKAGGWQYELVDEKRLVAGISKSVNINAFCTERTAIKNGFDQREANYAASRFGCLVKWISYSPCWIALDFISLPRNNISTKHTQTHHHCSCYGPPEKMPFDTGLN
ncbi:hypothetical protein CWS02_14920 [Enterobacter sp. EA-1]|nr:hypothetical protein CWS02_14920 [Enterobacter sp. EA-1]